MRSSSWSPRAAWQRDSLALSASALLFVALIFGGGGAEGPIQNGWLEAGGALLLIACVAGHFSTRPQPRGALAPILLLGMALIVIAAQLVPLPPDVWTSLPGRQTAVAAAALSGSPAWRPLSLDPEATRRTAAALLLPAGILLAVLATNLRGLTLIARTFVLAALLSALLGAVQISLGTPEAFAPYGNPEPGSATGVFANRNHQAQLMLLALVMTGLLIRLEDPQVRIRRRNGEFRFHLGWLLFPIFIALAVATQSRAGMALLVPALAAAIAVALTPKGSTRLFALSFAGVAAAVAMFAFADRGLKRLTELQSALTTEGRFINMPDITYTLDQYWPWGSGLGTFDPVFRANENLDLVRDRYLNHAHNDYLELLIETGIPGAVLLVLGLLLITVRLAALARQPKRAGNPTPAMTGFAMLILLLLHSLVDYPLRTDALAAAAAVAVAFLFSAAQSANDIAPEKSRRRRKGFVDPIGGFVSRRSMV